MKWLTVAGLTNILAFLTIGLWCLWVKMRCFRCGDGRAIMGCDGNAIIGCNGGTGLTSMNCAIMLSTGPGNAKMGI